MKAEKGKECRDYQTMIETVRRKDKAYEVGKDNPLKELRNVHDELHIVESDVGCLLFAGHKLVPPNSAKQELLKMRHKTHLGEGIIWSNMKKIWHWPPLKNDLKTMYE